MPPVGSTVNTANPTRPRKEKRFTYVLRDSNDYKHCSGINCVKVGRSVEGVERDFLFTGSRDGTLKRWELGEDTAACRATFESHVDWVNDVVLTGVDTLVSCSSDTTLKTWRAFSNRECTRTFKQHSDYVTSLASARQSNIVASGGLGCEVFIWDLEAAMTPIARASHEGAEEGTRDGSFTGGAAPLSDRSTIAKSDVTAHPAVPQGYAPILAKGHKESIYALSMNDAGTTLVSGGTEKAVRVWDPRTGTKQIKLKGHTDNVRALVLDPTGRFCLSGSSDSMIRLWDLGQQRCVHSYAVHTDSVWALASTPSFSHVYSGGRDLSVYVTDLATRESTLLCLEEQPVQQLALQGDDSLWVATTDSSLNKWPVREKSRGKTYQRASSFVAGSLPFARARACMDGSAPQVPLYTTPAAVIPGTSGIVRHAILNDRRHVLTKDAAGVVKRWEITRGTVINDYGVVSFEQKEKDLFEMVSVPAWFTMDTRLGSISVHLDTPQCFSAEMYAVDLQVPNATDELKLNLGQETLRGLLAHWLSRRRHKVGPAANGDAYSGEPGVRGDHGTDKKGVTDDSHDNADNHHVKVLPAFEFPTASPPSIITEGSQGGPWRKKSTDLDGTEDEKELPVWCIDCVLHSRLPPRDNAKCSFFLQPFEGTSLQGLTQGKLSAPRILRIHKVVNYVLEKLVIDRPLDENGSETTSTSGHGGNHQTGNGYGSSRHTSQRAWQQPARPVVEILCNNQVLPPDMSLATVRAYIWKKPDDLYLYYRTASNR
ncbi:unnamed protein product [Calypogeia fissa]